MMGEDRDINRDGNENRNRDKKGSINYKNKRSINRY